MGILRRIARAWIALSHALGVAVSAVVLTVLWVLAIGVYGVGVRLASLRRGLAPPPDTFWVPSPPAPERHLGEPF